MTRPWHNTPTGPTHMPRVNTCVRGHGSTDRHDEWLEVPTRRQAHKLARTESKVTCSQHPHFVTAIQRIPFTHRTDLLRLIISYHNNGTVTPHVSACGWVNVHTVHLCICLSSPCILVCLYIQYVNVSSEPCKWPQWRLVEYVNLPFWRACVPMSGCISECEFVRVCMCPGPSERSVSRDMDLPVQLVSLCV